MRVFEFTLQLANLKLKRTRETSSESPAIENQVATMPISTKMIALLMVNALILGVYIYSTSRQ